MPAPIAFDSAGHALDAGMFVQLCPGTPFYNYAVDCGLEGHGLYWVVDPNTPKSDPTYTRYTFPATAVNGVLLTCDDEAMIERAWFRDSNNTNRPHLLGSDLVQVPRPVTCTLYEADMAQCSTAKEAIDGCPVVTGSTVTLSVWGTSVVQGLIAHGNAPAAATKWEYTVVSARDNHVVCKPLNMAARDDLAQLYGSRKIHFNYCDLRGAPASVQRVNSMTKAAHVDKHGHPLQVGDYVTIDPVILNAMPSLSAIVSAQDEFELSSTLPGSTADFVLLAVNPNLRAAIQAVRQPLEAASYALLFSAPAKGGQAAKAASSGAVTGRVSAANQQGHPPMDHNGAILSVGDIVKLTPAATGTWGIYLSIDPTEEFEIVQFSNSPVSNYITLKSLDPVRHARYTGLIGGPLYVEENDIEFVRSRAVHGVATTGHYAPVLADKPLDRGPGTGEKYFDHASLGTDLSGDDLMKSIRDFCEGNGHV